MNPKTEADITLDGRQGIIEQRTSQAINNLTFLHKKKDWPSLKSIAKVISELEQTNAAEKHPSKRYIIYLPSCPSQK